MNNGYKNKKPPITLAKEFINENYEVRYNVISNRFEYMVKDIQQWEELNENDILVDLLEHHHKISSRTLIALLKSSFVPKYNPFKDYFENIEKWDNIDYIDQLSGYIEVYDEDKLRFKTQLKKMFVRTVASALEINLNKQSFILVHKKQNSGKSTFIRWLCPKKLENYYTEDLSLDKDGLVALAENFIINLDELSTLSKKDINALKSHMSKESVKVRLPYDARTSFLKRRCSFLGSTNNDEFLSDDTGNVRWVCFAINKINWDYKKDLNIDKIWSQAYYLFKNGFDYQLSKEEIEENEKANTSFLIRTPELELIQQYYYPGTKANPFAKFRTATEIMHELAQKAYSVKLYENRIGKALNILGFTKTGKYNKESKFTVKGYYIVEKDLEEKENNGTDKKPKVENYINNEIPFN